MSWMKGSSYEAFCAAISREFKTRLKEGKSRDQSVAIALGTAKKKHKNKDKMVTGTVT